MYGFTIGQENHAQKLILHFGHLDPTSNPTVSLNCLPYWCPNGPINPFVSNNSPIRS